MGRAFAENKILVGLSIDGTKAIHDANRLDAEGARDIYTHEKAAAILEAAGAEFNILCVVTSALARHGAKVFDALVSAGFRYLQFIQCIDGFGSPPTPYSLSAERWGEFLCVIFDRYYEHIRRGDYVSVRPLDNFMELAAGSAKLLRLYRTVRPSPLSSKDGGVYPCDFYVLDRYRMGQYMRHEHIRAARNRAGKGDLLPSPSRSTPPVPNAEWFALCRGRMPQASGAAERRHTDPQQILRRKQAIFEYAYPRMRELLRYIRI